MTLFNHDPQYWWYMLPNSVKFLCLMIAILFFTIRREIKKENQ